MRTNRTFGIVKYITFLGLVTEITGIFRSFLRHAVIQLDKPARTCGPAADLSNRHADIFCDLEHLPISLYDFIRNKSDGGNQ